MIYYSRNAPDVTSIHIQLNTYTTSPPPYFGDHHPYLWGGRPALILVVLLGGACLPLKRIFSWAPPSGISPLKSSILAGGFNSVRLQGFIIRLFHTCPSLRRKLYVPSTLSTVFGSDHGAHPLGAHGSLVRTLSPLWYLLGPKNGLIS